MGRWGGAHGGMGLVLHWASCSPVGGSPMLPLSSGCGCHQHADVSQMFVASLRWGFRHRGVHYLAARWGRGLHFPLLPPVCLSCRAPGLRGGGF